MTIEAIKIDEALPIPEFFPLQGVFAHGEVVIEMTEFKGRLIVATNNNIYEVMGKRLVKLRLEGFDEDAVVA